jgi:hypothetical protein
MKHVVLVEFLTALGGCLAAGVLGLLLGATYGGNHPLPFEISWLRGYELGGVLGAMLCGLCGAALGAFSASRLLSQAGNVLWSLGGAVLGAVPAGAALFLLPDAWFFAFIGLVPPGAVVGLEAGKRHTRSRTGKNGPSGGIGRGNSSGVAEPR